MDAKALGAILGCIVGAGHSVACASEECVRFEETYESPIPPLDAGARADWSAISCEEACAEIYPDEHVGGCTRSEGFVTCNIEKPVSCRPYRPMAGRPARDYVARTIASDELAAWFTHLAEIEAASVPSFLDLARDLERHGLDRVHVDEARRSADDERRHARMMRRLARRAGASPTRMRPPSRRPPMTLVELTSANAAEGCVGELFAAAVATWAACNARDREHRVVLQQIAVDETRHAAFALCLERELMPRLDSRARRRVASARTKAEQQLRESIASCPKLARAGIHPPPAMQQRILAIFSARGWS